MSDIFREVEEEVRRERLEKIWKLYGDYIVAGIALLVIAVAGYELYARYQANQRMQASETFMA
ncbi:MAG TPA: tetratricopeptide repeat protein, partial [Bradyrhizobium sp.]